MRLKALLLCEDVRFEVSGTFSIIGVLGERVTVAAPDGEIVFSKLAFLAVLGGLRGVEELAFRQWIRNDDTAPTTDMRIETHDPTTDEHNFVWTQSPMVFPDAGTYEVGIDVEVAGRRITYRYSFAIERSS